jgi:hypothetical protein
MWMYPEPSCPDHPISMELGDTKINTQIQGVPPHGADLNFDSGKVPLREGVESPWVSPLKLILIYLYQFLLLKRRAFFLALDLRYARRAPQGSPCLRTR